jgi:protoheme IX farnesyltransferase
MILRVAEVDAAAAGGRRWADFFELTKPRVVVMVLVTTFVGFYLASDPFSPGLKLFETLVGTALAAGGTLALNQFLERRPDALMERTRRRPLPEGRVLPGEALVFGVVITAAGLVILAVAVNWLSAFVTAFIAASYLFAYTPLKQKSSLCGPVGSVPGALPPVVGWVAADGALGAAPCVLFGILFLWQIPHTLAIARLYRDDFAKAGIRFLPVIEPDGRSTARHVITHCSALVSVSLLPTLIGIAGSVYFAVALLLGLGFLACGGALAWSQSAAAARRLLFASLIYLPLLLVTMALDRVAA